MLLRRTHNRRQGAILPLLAVSLIALFGMVALAIDLGMVALARTQCQNAADIAAMAAVRVLTGDATTNNNYDAAEPAARAAAEVNRVLGTTIDPDDVTVEVGYYAYNSTLQRFEATFSGSKPAAENWSAVRVTVSAIRPIFFARVFTRENVTTGERTPIREFTAGASATAVHRPRDIALVLDFSGSMRFSTLSAYPRTGDKVGSLNPDPKYPKFGHWDAMASVMNKTTAYIDSNGEVYAPNNLTVETENGSAVVNDFLTRDGSGMLTNAFVRTSASYDPAVWAVPGPQDWDVQSDATITYVGDKWPRFSKLATGSYASTVQEYLFGNNNAQANDHAKSATAKGPGNGPFEPLAAALPLDGEGYGPDFRGYSMGPGWYGKTFYVWPPDPRFAANPATWAPDASNPAKDNTGKWMADWRKRFFYQQGNTNPVDDNSRLWDSGGLWRQAGQSGAYDINYTAVIQWIKTGPKVFPDNLRAGRVLYYSSIPDNLPATGGSEDQRFWRGYINYVIGSGSANTQEQSLYGRHTTAWGTVKITPKSSLNSDPLLQPYMHYNDNPVRPRLNFWFGPLTMLDFISRYTNNWLPGTCHESQCWQLKAGIQSALKDIEKNHPNDWVAEMFFSNESDFYQARVKLGRDYARMKNALFFPYTLLSNLGDPNAEIRPYQNNDSLTWDNPGNIPSATGGTAPEMGFKVAYNELSSRSGYNGRRGAAKVVIFETDGVPNHTATGGFTNAGAYNSYYSVTGATTSYGNNHPTVTTAALDVIQTICNLDTHATKPGYSTTKMPARAHAIGFGDLFQYISTSRDEGLAFLLEVQKKGNTSPAGATGIENYKIITGDFNTRIENLRIAMERIMQSGIQVSLIR